MTRSFVSPLSRPIQGPSYRQRLRKSATYCRLCSEVSHSSKFGNQNVGCVGEAIMADSLKTSENLRFLLHSYP